MFDIYIKEVWNILLELGYPLILGIVIAGLVHVILPKGFVHKNFGKKGISSILKAVLIGVPMPLCSCGVVPTAIGLKQDGASNGASTGFLISTPQTGVDSILVSATFLGWPFALFKLVVAFITGIVGGIFVDLFDNETNEYSETDPSGLNSANGGKSKLKEAFDFGIHELLGMIYFWIIIGVFVAALITTLVPPGYLANIGWITGIGGMFLMLLISLPLYVCATASVPIAASLIAAGMPAGTALVLLMAGPASNIATVGAVFKAFGGKVLGIYLATVSIFSILFGWLFGFIIEFDQTMLLNNHEHMSMFKIICALIMVGLLIYLTLYKLRLRYMLKTSRISGDTMGIKLDVKGMTCQHCAKNVSNALRKVSGVDSVRVSVDDGVAVIEGTPDVDKLIESVKQAGYEAALINR